ncbi:MULTISPECIES: 16S rRNA (guanine(966)-N(2))-methyltransferase RsmD [Microbacterium]|uniref:16S rRNA (guanine(966)-N(2))-methyltransferase RsmD n=1 Tax=Microbacterium TaxID=33882 RepID=UPI00249DB127|nr:MULTISPECIES: 16S rRNA (guanine(966)-N(2))-methyltransferase RsmD [Microbacterium]WHE37551.1 16S rRNA (guanine(966)-N(2))-methyltransferase RsmD [Microbacterium sp. BDGP8]WRK18731.1 16S rRNA (guanine(966)-N(2))-methyltransferase RsmD [Microbacterium plantarum]
MTRIIAGAAGSLVLRVPDRGTRPTSDRVRESLFGGLDASGVLDGARVLDLYAGSGALGLEAVSRGAASVDLVEKSASAAAVTDRNARTVARAVGSSAVRVHRSSADAFLQSASGPFDLVFIDPPYDLDDEALAITLALLADVTAPGAVVIVERASRSPQPRVPAQLEPLRSKRYGDTALWWYERADNGGQPPAPSQSR